MSQDGNWGLDLCRYPLFVLRCSISLPDYSLYPIWSIIAWSLNAPLSSLGAWNYLAARGTAKHNLPTYLYLSIYIYIYGNIFIPSGIFMPVPINVLFVNHFVYKTDQVLVLVIDMVWLTWFAYVAEALSEGVHPSVSYDGSPLPSLHRKFAGKPIAGQVTWPKKHCLWKHPGTMLSFVGQLYNLFK
jgi:hypothetical protein